MPLAEADFADQEDNSLFRHIKTKQWGNLDYSLANTRDRYGNTPLHAALGYQAPDDVLVRLLTAYPDAVKVHGSDEWLPLRVAAMWGASTPICEQLIRAYPAALDDRGQEGIKGRTPRHFSARFPHNKELLERSTQEWIEIIERER